MGLTISSKAFAIDLGGGVAINGEVKASEDGIRKPVLLLSHGFRGFKDWGVWPYVSSWFAERGFYVVTFDFSRISVKKGDFDEASQYAAFTLSQELADLDTLLQNIKEERLPLAELADTSQIALLGHSRVGSSNIVFASEHSEIGAVIALNASDNPTPLGDGPLEVVILADLQKDPERFNISQKLASFSGTALIIQGEQDNERLLEGFKSLRAAAPQQTFVSIPGADHSFGVSHPFSNASPYLEEALEVVLSFLLKWKK